MLTLYHRHTKKCSHRTCRRNRCAVAKKRADGQITKCACTCPIWVDGFHNGGEIRRSLRQSTWDDAVEVLETLKDNKGQSVRPEPITIENAKKKFLDDMEHCGLAEVTIYKYRIMFKQLKALAIARGLRYLKELDLDQLTEFRAGWKDGPRSSVKKLERLRAWLAFCHEREWISKNPAKNLRSPKVKDLT